MIEHTTATMVKGRMKDLLFLFALAVVMAFVSPLAFEFGRSCAKSLEAFLRRRR